MVYQKKLFTSIAIISILFIGINIQFVNAEIKLDKAFLRIVYAFTQENITRESLLSRTDTMYMDIGSRYSEFYDMTAFAKDSLKKLVFQPGRVKSVSVIKNQQIAESVINVNKFGDGNVFLPNSYISFTIYKDRDEKHIYTLDKVSDMSETSIFLDEEISPQQWTIDSDTCRILDYLCYRATTKFGGREYEVFFTPEIPINEGPWKLYGLPGLILAAITSDGIFSFQSIGIQKVNDKSISIPDGKNSEVCKDLNHYQQFVQSKAKNESYTFEKNGAITIVDKFTSKNVILLETEEN
jgi:GLPGLI family protein